MKNAFGMPIPERKNIFNSSKCRDYISLVLDNFLDKLGIKSSEIPASIERILQEAQAPADDYSYEAGLYEFLTTKVSLDSLDKALEERAQRIFTQISPHLLKGTTLDYGCGDGGVGQRCEVFQGTVTLADVYCHPDVKKLKIPFAFLKQDAPSDFPSNHFDNVILCTVLHHSDYPMETLKDAIRVVKKNCRLLIIESVCGIRPDMIDNQIDNPLTRVFTTLSSDDQLAVNVFFDHFYNRCLHYSRDPAMKVNVPYNYFTHEGLPQALEQSGMRVESIIPSGIDQPLAPLFHTIFVTVKE